MYAAASIMQTMYWTGGETLQQEMHGGRMKENRRLTRGIVTGFAIMGVILGGLIIYFGNREVVKGISQQYYDMAYLIADSAMDEILSEMTPEEVLQCAQTAQSGTEEEKAALVQSDVYQKVERSLLSLKQNMRLADIYVASYTAEGLRSYEKDDASWKPLLYLFDCSENAETHFSFGERSAMNPGNIELFAEVVETKWPQDDYIISNGEFGYNMSALVPILTQDGEVAAVVGVEVPMLRIQSAAQALVRSIVLITFVVIVAVIIVFALYMLRRVVRPVGVISREVRRFGESGKRTEAGTKSLSTIRTRDEIQTLAEQIDKMELDMLSYVDNIKKITAEKERIGTELALAAKIQENVLPNTFPPFPDRTEFDLYATMTPAKEVGGDFYDFFLVDEDHLCLVMADVSGKGVPAALFMMASKTILANNAMQGKTPAEILEVTNEAVCSRNQEEMFVTVWLGILEISTGRLVAANAGHEFPAICPADGDYELYKDRHGFVLGGMSEMKYKNYELTLTPGTRLFVYTDGVPEATNKEEELFGTGRMVEALNRDKEAPLCEVLKHVRGAVDEFVKDAEQFDDMTMLCLEYRGRKENSSDGNGT